jgi:hypothetical protein
MEEKKLDMSKVTKEQWERLREMVIGELSAFFKLCPICENRFKDYLDNKIICISCERDQKIDNLLNKLK